MKKTLLALTVASFAAFGTARAQVYFSENFNSVSAPALPASWNSTPSGQWKTGSPNTLAPNASAGLGYNLNQPNYTSTIGIDGSLASSNNSILATPTISIPSGATGAASAGGARASGSASAAASSSTGAPSASSWPR